MDRSVVPCDAPDAGPQGLAALGAMIEAQA